MELNCDLGEGESPRRTVALLRLVTACNIASGGHAGTIKSMSFCLNQAGKLGVKAGAHPGIAQGAGFGRQAAPVTESELEMILLHQVSAFNQLALRLKVRPHHVKLHGALYLATEHSPALARHYIEIMRKYWPGLVVYGLAGGRVEKSARRAGHPFQAEAFADRVYRSSGHLLSRTEPKAILHDARDIVAQAIDITRKYQVRTFDGAMIRIRADTLCVHGDTRGALGALRSIRALLGLKKKTREPSPRPSPSLVPFPRDGR